MSFLSNRVSLLCAGACLVSCLDAAPPDATGVVQHKQIMVNQFLLEAILVNSLIGTSQNLQKLVSQPLSSAYFDVEQPQGQQLGLQLIDENAQIFMHYLVGCALGEDDPPVVWTHPDDPQQQQQWDGRLGLCSSWATEPASDACLQVVSACLLARENAEGLSVATSQRGAMPSGDAIPLSATVPAHAQHESGQPIESLQPCDELAEGASRDCGFAPASSLVGVCKPGEEVTVSCAQGSGDGVVRICEGHRGCDLLDSATVASEAHVCSENKTISFDCPSSGSYAAMVGAQLSSDTPAMTLVASTGTYPASEAQVFDVREAAFYGTLLSPRYQTGVVTSYVDRATHDVVRNVVPNASPTPVSSAMWACSDHGWAVPDAYLLHRLCAVIVDDQGDVAYLCAAQPVGTCNAAIDDAPTNLCAAVDAAPVTGDGDFDDCKDPGNGVWHHPITVYLDHPCDVVPQDSTGICSRIPPPLPAPQ